LDIIWKLIRDEKNIGNQDKYEMLLEFDKVLELDLDKVGLSIKIPEDISDLIKKREEYRKKKDWENADRVRDEIRKKGYIIEDTPHGIRYKAH
jgi:cysteinyl-tRNA synthetase